MHNNEVVAKFYYAKKKFVWEILKNGVKSKIEIRWIHVIGIRALFDVGGEFDVLDIELNEDPQFYKEIFRLPRKYPIWDRTPDFTDGQASIVWRHTVWVRRGTLRKHYKDILKCDARLNMLSSLYTPPSGIHPPLAEPLLVQPLNAVPPNSGLYISLYQPPRFNYLLNVYTNFMFFF
ncbi:hypothetical protein QJS04_geneDACA007088 [Acorus gramineus]|uniref:TRF2/HOY1 PH-like domain-containing protein n=1 Tax=Acorus gramineus TaxID=55184 RepID=A0AAV9BNQ6_ACOGR|nr:hypothetical protein QJS04_geneDACA007088 [Acorus gramineus]